jgi:endo-1,4-beta-D-glucanase Y
LLLLVHERLSFGTLLMLQRNFSKKELSKKLLKQTYFAWLLTKKDGAIRVEKTDLYKCGAMHAQL